MVRFSSTQMVVSTSAALFLVAVFTHFGTSDGIPGISSGFAAGVSTTLMRNKSLKTLLERSEKLWEKTVKQRHEVFGKFPTMGFFPAINGPTYFTYPYSVWDLFPASFNCPFEVERVGRMGDGGKWVCGLSRYERNARPCILYSFGVQNESSFEEEMLQRTNCEIWGYDYSVEQFGPAIQNEHASRVHFMKAGIGGVTDTNRDPPFYSIQDLMKMNGHDHIDILKIDVEYAEFEALSSYVDFLRSTMASTVSHPTAVSRIGQMLLEIHIFRQTPDGGPGISLPAFLAWWESLESIGLRPAWTEPNLLAVTLGFEDVKPRLAEYTFVTNASDARNLLWS